MPPIRHPNEQIKLDAKWNYFHPTKAPENDQPILNLATITYEGRLYWPRDWLVDRFNLVCICVPVPAVKCITNKRARKVYYFNKI